MAEDNEQKPEAASEEATGIQNKLEYDLMEAATVGDVESATKLLHASVDANTKDNEGDTPLLQAVTWGHPDVVKVLLAAGADPDLANNDGETPLIRAAVFMTFIESPVILEALIDGGADPAKTDPAGTNAYVWALSAGNKKGAKYLHSKGTPIPDKIF